MPNISADLLGFDRTRDFPPLSPLLLLPIVALLAYTDTLFVRLPRPPEWPNLQSTRGRSPHQFEKP